MPEIGVFGIKTFIFKWKQVERWDFVIWQGADGDAVRAPLAVRDDVQSTKERAHTIPFQDERHQETYHGPHTDCRSFW